MKKNGEYVGVDEKFIPEDEKYVDDSLLGNREETTKKVGKVVKTIGIGYLIYSLIGLIIFVIILVIALKFINGTFNQVNKNFDNFGNTYSSVQSQISNTQDQISKSSFNLDFENYSGTVRKTTLSTLIDNIAKNNKTNSSNIITVIYQDKSIVEGNEIIELKKQFLDNKQYEVILDYDENGYVNQATIQDI